MPAIDDLMRVVEEVISASTQLSTAHRNGETREQQTDDRKHYAARWCALRDMLKILLDDRTRLEFEATMLMTEPATKEKQCLMNNPMATRTGSVQPRFTNYALRCWRAPGRPNRSSVNAVWTRRAPRPCAMRSTKRSAPRRTLRWALFADL